MIDFLDITGKSPEFHEAYQVISANIEPAFVEPEDYVLKKFRIQEDGAKNEEERLIVPEGYRIRLIAARDEQSRRIVGAVSSVFIPKIGEENRGFGLIGYLAVLPGHRRRGIGRELLEKITQVIQKDALAITGKAAACLLFEIEDEGKEPMERLAKTVGAWPLDIDYYQPTIREEYGEQRLNLWFMRLEHPVRSFEEPKKITYPAKFIHDMAKSLFVYEYTGPNGSGFKETSKSYQALLASLKGRTRVGFKTGPYHGI